jgi:curved DNA-binding protein CbpA
MNFAEQGHYEVLGVDQAASMSDIQAEYRQILLANHPDKTQHYAPFRRSHCDKLIRAANAAWEVLSNSISKAAYDRKLPPESPYSNYASSSGGGFGACPPYESKPWEPFASEARTTDDTDESDATTDKGEAKEAEYRTMQTPVGTVFDIKISDWRLHILVSNKFRFINDGSELSNANEDTATVTFEIGLERDKSSSETWGLTSNELTIKVQDVPASLHVSKVLTLFRELNTRTTSLTITLIAGNKRKRAERTMLWEFGFDFDMNNQFATINRQRGTCMMFSVDEPPAEVQNGRGIGTPEHVLKEDKQLNANAWCFWVIADRGRRCTGTVGKRCGEW